jgi:hypothetical protein
MSLDYFSTKSRTSVSAQILHLEIGLNEGIYIYIPNLSLDYIIHLLIRAISMHLTD